jgi:nucleotide-binding universal stress UspA family protein
MKRFQHILCVLTLRDTDTAVLGWTAVIARLAGAGRVTCLHVWSPPEIPAELIGQYSWSHEPEQFWREGRIGAAVDRHLELPSAVQRKVEVRRGNTLGAVLDLLDNDPADIVIVGRDVEDGSLPEKLARKAPCSVMSIPAGSPVRCEKLVCAVDFSQFSAGALEVAAAFAHAAGAALTLFHAQQLARGPHRALVRHEQLVADARAHAVQELSALARPLEQRKINTGIVVAEAGLPACAVTDMVREGDFDAVVIGCRGRHAIYASLLGSTAETILRSCGRPVIAVKAKGSGRSLLEHMRAMG